MHTHTNAHTRPLGDRTQFECVHQNNNRRMSEVRSAEIGREAFCAYEP
jgi:hypothetical protein